MTNIRIGVINPRESEKWVIQLPDDVPIRDLQEAIVELMGLPTHGQNGEQLRYYLNIRTAEGKLERLENEVTLGEHDLKDNDVLQLNVEMVAGCFPAGTLITLPDGTRIPIEEVMLGTFVLSYSIDGYPRVQSQVTGIYHGIETRFLSINKNLEVTPSHLLQVNGSWVRADSVRVGDHLQNENGEDVEVYSIEVDESEREVYNIDLDAKTALYAEGLLVSDLDEKFAKRYTNFFANGYLVNTLAAKRAIARPLPTVLNAIGIANPLPKESGEKGSVGSILHSFVGKTTTSPTGGRGGISINREINSSLRDWWHKILRGYGHYSCYGVFLLLPSDKEAIKYFVDFGDELDLITASDCLIIALSKDEFHTPINRYDDNIWQSVIDKQISEGHSIKVADFFGIDYEHFPCIVLFKDIRSPKHILISLKDLSPEEIAAKLRKIFSIIHKASNLKLDPLDAIRHENDKQIFKSKGKSIIGEVQNIVGKTFETGMEAWINSLFSPK